MDAIIEMGPSQLSAIRERWGDYTATSVFLQHALGFVAIRLKRVAHAPRDPEHSHARSWEAHKGKNDVFD